METLRALLMMKSPLMRLCITATALGLLTACSAPKTPQTTGPNTLPNDSTLAKVKHFEISGKLGFSDGQKGENATLLFKQNNEDYAIRLYGPLGGSLQIVGQPGNVSLTDSNGRTHCASTGEELVQQVLGWTIPVSDLQYWVRGLPAPGTPPTQKQYNSAKQLVELEQQGWKIIYSEYRAIGNTSAPYLLTLFNGSVRIKLILQNWSFPVQN